MSGTITLAELDRRMKLAPARVRAALRSTAYDTVRDAQARVRANIAARFARGSGRLAGSVRTRLSGMSPALVGGSGIDYYAIQEDGGTIHSHGRLLAIPMPGVTGEPRSHGELRFVPTARGGVLVDRAGRVLYVLRHRVTLRGRGFTRDGFMAAVAEVPRVLGPRVDEATIGTGEVS